MTMASAIRLTRPKGAKTRAANPRTHGRSSGRIGGTMDHRAGVSQIFAVLGYHTQRDRNQGSRLHTESCPSRRVRPPMLAAPHQQYYGGSGALEPLQPSS